MLCASGERPGGRTGGLTDRNGDKCFETFNHNHVFVKQPRSKPRTAFLPAWATVRRVS